MRSIKDDGETVTEEWLRSIGFIGKDSYRVATCPSAWDSPDDPLLRGPILCFGFLPVLDDAENPRAWLQYFHRVKYGFECANVPIPMVATRGEVRRLLAILGIQTEARI